MFTKFVCATADQYNLMMLRALLNDTAHNRSMNVELLELYIKKVTIMLLGQC